MQHPVPAHRLAIVLDPHRRGFGSAQGVYAQQIGQRPVVHADDLGDLQERDQLQPVRPWVRDSS